MAVEPCAGCGWLVDGGSTRCRERFDAFLARDYSDPRYFACHRLLVDAYSLQHPDEFCRSAKSFAGHLVGLAAVVVDGAGAARRSDALARWLGGSVCLAKPPLPQARGEITIGDLPDTDDPDLWADAVNGWARAVWAAYADLHAVAHTWMRAIQTA